MSYILSILDGVEQGIEITLENETIYSLGTQDDSDFYLRKNLNDFLVFFRVVGEQVEWWSQKKIAAEFDDDDQQLDLNKVQLPLDGVFELFGRSFGVFSSREKVSEAQAKLSADQVSVELKSGNETDSPDVELSEVLLEEAAPLVQPILENEEQSAILMESEAAEDSEQADAPDLEVVETGAPQVVDSGLSFFTADTLDEDNPESVTSKASEDRPAAAVKIKNKNTTSTLRNSKLLYFAKLFPFIMGFFAVMLYLQQTNIKAPEKTVIDPAAPELQQENETEIQNSEAQSGSVDSVDQYLQQTGLAGAGDAAAPMGQPEFIASGAEYKGENGQWQGITPIKEDNRQALETLRAKVNSGTIAPEAAAEVLFPDEKMMTLIKDMLDTAGAEGIDVRFNRGNYDVFGYVQDDEKWQRIFKILTFDLDLTKVQFSVETSVSLINKFESLLKKFNLSDYAVLSLASNGNIYAKTYYPPALEGLWYTIKSRFENKYGQYTEIQEYRAHIGWINIVKVSFDQPSYVLLSDGRRLVEGSIWGGSSVLDKIYHDSIRVTTGPTKARYYVINKSRAIVGAGLSD